MAAITLSMGGSLLPAHSTPVSADTRLPAARHAAQTTLAQPTVGPATSGGLRSTTSEGPTVLRFVTASPGNVRSGPSTSYRVVGTIERGVRIRGVLRSDGWVDLPGDRFVSSVILSSTPPDDGGSSQGPTVLRFITASPGNVRSGPSTSYRVVGTIDRGVRIRGVLRSDGWVDLPGDRFVSSVILSESAPGGGTTPPGSSPPPSSGPFDRAQLLSVAQQYTGVRYLYGGEDPSGFDCSGYSQFVFGQVGVSLPRTAAQQLAATTPTSSPLPGDLVFWGSWHVGIYAGNGYVYDAGRSTQQTQKRPVFPGVTSYGRVG